MVPYDSGMKLAEVPPAYRTLVDRHGLPVEVEEARSRWAELVAVAESGTITLITREGLAWAALVPMSEVAEPATRLPVWALSAGRAKLGWLVLESQAQAQVLTRHRRPVAAVIGAHVLGDRPEPADRIAAEKLLEDGRRIVLQFDPGTPGRMGHDGEVAEYPEPSCYTATAIDWDDNT